jgi:hypothetical protein
MNYDHWLLSGPGGPYDCSQPDCCIVCNGNGCEECNEEDAMSAHTFFQDRDPQARVTDHTRLKIGDTAAVVEIDVDGNKIMLFMRSPEAVISLAAKLQQSAAQFTKDAYLRSATHENVAK